MVSPGIQVPPRVLTLFYSADRLNVEKFFRWQIFIGGEGSHPVEGMEGSPLENPPHPVEGMEGSPLENPPHPVEGMEGTGPVGGFLSTVSNP
jgi:hypothetical protein